MAAHQGSPSLGFSRQEHWSGLPFPSPMHESEKWKWSRSVVSDSSDPWTAAYQASPSMGFSRQKYWSGVPLPSPHFYLRAFNLDNIVPDLPIILLPGFCKAILSLRMSQYRTLKCFFYYTMWMTQNTTWSSVFWEIIPLPSDLQAQLWKKL